MVEVTLSVGGSSHQASLQVCLVINLAVSPRQCHQIDPRGSQQAYLPVNQVMCPLLGLHQYPLSLLVQHRPLLPPQVNRLANLPCFVLKDRGTIRLGVVVLTVSLASTVYQVDLSQKAYV